MTFISLFHYGAFYSFSIPIILTPVMDVHAKKEFFLQDKQEFRKQKLKVVQRKN
jgi:hypothetical protein